MNHANSSSSPTSETGKNPHAPIVLALLTGQQVNKEDLGPASALALDNAARESGPMLLTKSALAHAHARIADEATSEGIRLANARLIGRHEAALLTLLYVHKSALLTVLAAPVSAKDDECQELKAARQELGSLIDRLFTQRALPGIPELFDHERGRMLTGVASDVYSLIKDHAEFTDLKEVAEKRRIDAKARLAMLQAGFEARFADAPGGILARVRMVGRIADYQNDPDALCRQEKKSLVTPDGGPVFKDGRLTAVAKEHLVMLGRDAANPGWVAWQIRAILAKDAETDL